MRVKPLSSYHWFAWLVSAALAYWAYRFQAEFLWLHEFGHIVFGLGGDVDWRWAWDHCYPNVSWYGTDIGGSAFPIIAYAWLGRFLQRWFPPLWAIGGMTQALLLGWNYFGGDYPHHSTVHLAGELAVFAFSLYNLFKPTRTGRLRDFLAAHGFRELARRSPRPTASIRSPHNSKTPAATASNRVSLSRSPTSLSRGGQ